MLCGGRMYRQHSACCKCEISDFDTLPINRAPAKVPKRDQGTRWNQSAGIANNGRSSQAKPINA